jgi:hypothetical protein
VGLGASLLTASAPGPRPVASLEGTLEGGILAGVASAAAMALVTMVAAAVVLDLGLYTPLYLVTAIVEPGPLVESMQEAAAGFRFFLELGAAVAGGAVHLGIGAGFGALFALLARALRLRGPVAVLAGAGYGLAVMALMGQVLIPWGADQTAGGELIADAPRLIGLPVATVAHVVYGLGLGAWAAASARGRVPSDRERAAS